MFKRVYEEFKIYRLRKKLEKRLTIENVNAEWDSKENQEALYLEFKHFLEDANKLCINSRQYEEFKQIYFSLVCAKYKNPSNRQVWMQFLENNKHLIIQNKSVVHESND